jgi:hypothetical protein
MYSMTNCPPQCKMGLHLLEEGLGNALMLVTKTGTFGGLEE